MSDTEENADGGTERTECPHCGAAVPAAEYCGACGAHLAYPHAGAARRFHAYAPFPEEPVLRISVTTSMFPHLSRNSKLLFRLAVGVIVALLVLFALLKWQAPMIAVAACGFPILYLLYVVEIDDPERSSFRVPVAVALLLGAVLGVAWGIVGGRFVDRALSLTLGVSLTTSNALIAAVVVPAVGVVLMAVPVTVLRIARHSSESLDGFVLGAVGALAFGLAASIEQLSSLLRTGQVSELSFTSTLTQVALRGFASPLIAALTIGLFGAGLWLRRHNRVAGFQRVATQPVFALAFALLVAVGLGFCDIAVLPDLALLLVHLVAAALVVVVTRVCLHDILLAELHPVTIGAPEVCPHCRRLVPAMAFCPHCGVARVATAPRHRAQPAATPAVTGGVAALGLPGSVHFRHVGPDEESELPRLGHLRVFALMLSVMAVASVALVITSVVLQPPPPIPCHQLFKCAGGPGLDQLVTNGHQYSSSKYGFSLEYGPNSGVHVSTSDVTIDYVSDNGSAEWGQVQIAGLPSNGMSATQVVSTVAQQIDSNAQPVYVVPNPFVGFQYGAGEAYNYVVNGSSNSQGLGRMIILAAVRGELALIVVDSGPYLLFSNSNNTVMGINPHASPADQFAALFADPVVNSVKWPSASFSG
jgi:hypothetical protein